MTATIEPSFAYDISGYSSMSQVQRSAVVERSLELLLNAVKINFKPIADPWASTTRWNLGDGYYVLCKGLSPHGALKIAYSISSELHKKSKPDVDELLKIRLVLGYGHVEPKFVNNEPDRFEGLVLTEIGRLLDGPILRDTLDNEGCMVISASKEFVDAWRLDPLRNAQDGKISEIQWFPYSDSGKREELWEGYMLNRKPNFSKNNEIAIEIFSKVSVREDENIDQIYNFLRNNRKTLSEFIISNNYYTDAMRENGSPKFPLLTKDWWLPKKLIDIRDIILELKDRKDDYRYPKFSDSYRKISDYKKEVQNERISNDRIYRLVDVEKANGLPKFICDSTHYDIAIDNQEAIAFETARWYINNERKNLSNDGSSLPIRGKSSNAWNLRLRECAWSTNTITIVRNHPDQSDFFYVHERIGKQLAEGKNTVSVVPAGTFQPLILQNWREDFSLEFNIMREFMEEMLGREEYQRIVDSETGLFDHDRTKMVLDAREENRIHLYYTGFGFDFLTLKPGLISIMIIDWNDNKDLFREEFVENWEGIFSTIPFTKRNLLKMARNEKALSYGAACCLQAYHLFDEIYEKH